MIMLRRHLAIPGLTIALALLACTLSTPIEVGAPAATVEIPTALPAATSVPPTRMAGASPSVLPGDIDLAALYAKVSPGVVTIWNFADLGTPHDPTIPAGQGSGFVIDTDGHIVTNVHVIDGASEIEVDFPSGVRTWATLVGTDTDSDVAVLKVDLPAEQLTPIPLGDSDQVNVGDFAVAIGNPFGLSGTMTIGIVSAVGRTLDSEHASPGGQPFTAGDIIQTDAAINPGNSGGPLINLQGEVVGINRAIRTETFTVSGDAANSGVGFAVPINIVRRVAPALIANGRYDYSYLGISSLDQQRMNLKILEAIGLPDNATGAYVTCVTPGGPADRAGVIGASSCDQGVLQAGGDLIIAVDGKPVLQFGDMLSYLINHTSVGQEITLTIIRNGKEVEVPLKLTARP
jgi:S1-C subfamily serine protease